MLFIKRVFEGMASFMQRFGTVYESTPLTFPQLDVEKIKLKLRLKEEALERGSKNLPLSNSENFDDVEHRITSFIGDQIRDVSQSYDDYQRAFEDRISHLKSIGPIERLEEIAGTAEADIKQSKHQGDIELHIAKSNVIEMEDYVKKFKAENHLDRPAIYPKNRFLLVAIIFALVVFETCVNGYFFAKGNELGLIGGIESAFIPSLLNIASAYVLGNYALRLLIHVSRIKRAFGMLFTILFPIGIFLINLLVAHYRTTMGLGVEHATELALRNLTSAPFSLGDVDSWLLLIAGCFCSLIATIDFWSMDDKYSGYGNIYREQQKRIDDYAHQKYYVCEELKHIRSEKFRELEEAYSLVTSRYGEAISILDNQARWNRLFNEYLDHLESVGRVLIGYYRSKNCEARTDDRPKYFLEEWVLEKKIAFENKKDHEGILENFKSDLIGSNEIYEKFIKRINDAYNVSIENL